MVLEHDGSRIHWLSVEAIELKLRPRASVGRRECGLQAPYASAWHAAEDVAHPEVRCTRDIDTSPSERICLFRPTSCKQT